MKKRVKLKQWMAVVLSIVMLAVMMPQAAFASTKLSGKFVQGAVRRSSDGSTYQFSKSEAGYISIYYYSTATGKVETFSGQYDGTEPKRSYLIKSDDGTTYKGYCVEHGVATNEDRKLSTLSENEVERLIYTGLSKKAKQNLELALLYGYQDGDSTRRLETSVKDGGLGFNDSKYYNKTSKTGYNTDDWYMATQCLIWEIQQRNRTDDMERVTNNLGVSANHYLSIISGRPAVDIYNWMVSCIKNHYKFPTKLNGLTEKHPAVIHLTKEHKVEGGYRYTFADSTKLGLDYALASVGAGEGDVLPVIAPADLVALVLHVLNKTLTVSGILQRFIDGLDKFQLPALAPQSRLILTGTHLLFVRVLFRGLQHIQAMSQTELIVDLPVPLQVSGVLMQLFTILTADAVDDQVVVQMVRVHMGGDQHLKVRELLPSELHADGVDLLRSDFIFRREGLDEVIELSAIGFLELPFRCHHFQIGRLRDAVVTCDQPLVIPHGLLSLRNIFYRSFECARRLLLVSHRGECRHHFTSVLMEDRILQRSA